MHVLTGARFTDVTNYCKEADEAFAGSSGRRGGTRYCVIGSAHLQGAPQTVTLMKGWPRDAGHRLQGFQADWQ
jgi:hypothetical protein